MRQFQTTITERKLNFQGEFTTHPYEAGWAGEAISFIRVENVSGETAELKAFIQISVDGVRWIDEGTAFQNISEKGDYFARVSHFGNYLRLRGAVSGDDANFKLTIWWVLKE